MTSKNKSVSTIVLNEQNEKLRAQIDALEQRVHKLETGCACKEDRKKWWHHEEQLES